MKIFSIFFVTVLVSTEVYCLLATDKSIKVKCDNTHSLDNTNDFQRFEETKSSKVVVIETCGTPTNSYADVLSAMNVNVNNIKEIVLINPQITDGHNNSAGPDIKKLQPKHFVGLDLEEIKVFNENTELLAIDLEFLNDLTSLTKLILKKLDIWGPFPISTKIENLELSDVVFRGSIGGCAKLKKLHANNMVLTDVDKRWITQCIKIEELTLENLSHDTSNKILERVSYRIQNVTIRNCSLEHFLDAIHFIGHKELRFQNKNLKHIDLSHNKIGYGPHYSLFNGLETLDLSYNKMDFFDLKEMYSDNLYNLRELKLDGNNFAKRCDDRFGYSSIVTQTRNDDKKYRKELETALRSVSLSGTQMPRLCFGLVLLPKLEFLNVSNNQITEINYRTFFWTHSDHLEVDMRHNPIEKVLFTKEDYDAMKRNDPAVARWSKITVRTDAQLPCDCSHAWFARALREQLLFVDGVQCANGLSILDPAVFKSC